jgi:hypothetical protein
MPNLASYSILNARVNKYKSDYSLDNLGSAFLWVCLETTLALNSTEIDEALVDDSGDGGIDAIHIIDTNVHVFTCTYAETFENASRNFPQNKLDNLAVTIQKIFSKDLKQTDVNPALWDKVKDIWSLLAVGTATLHFYICSNKQKPTSQAITRFEGSLKPYYFVQFKYFDLEDIVALIMREQHHPLNGEVTFIARNHFQKSDGPLKATVATISAIDLVNLVTDPDNSDLINENIFNDNVRVDLGPKNPINKGIKESALSEDNYEFWYLNNGIMLVCDQCSYVPNSVSPKALLTNVQIVNGGQTSRTLFHAYKENPTRVTNVDILVRIVETKDRSISQRISETANRQTPVKTRDLHANDWIQRKLEQDFLSLGYFYERKKNQHSDKPIDKRLDAELIAQVSLAYYSNMPSEARNSKSIVFGDEYSTIFNEDSVTAERLLFPYLIYKPLEIQKRAIQSKKRRRIPIPEEEAFKSLATFHILNTMKLVAEHENFDLSDDSQRAKALEKSVELVWDVVQSQMAKRAELYTHDRFFKEKPTNQLIYDRVKHYYES